MNGKRFDIGIIILELKYIIFFKSIGTMFVFEN